MSINPLGTQVSGDHYRKLKIQPVEYIHANGLPFVEGNVIKYVTRWRDKGGIEDLRKARHFLDLLIELETRQPQEASEIPKAPLNRHMTADEYHLFTRNIQVKTDTTGE